MRILVATVIGIVTLLGLPGLASAQAPVTTKASASAISSSEANNAATQQKLAQRIPADFTDIPFGEAIALIGERTGVETYVDRRALNDAAIKLGTTVSVDLKQVRADMLLDLILQQVSGDQIDYLVKDGIVVVTSVASLDGANEVKAYPVADLLKLQRSAPKPDVAAAPAGAAVADPFGDLGGAGLPADPNELPADVKQLVDVVQRIVAPDTWSDVGGHGTITYFGDMLVIRQNARTHREIEKVLALLRETAAKNASK